MPKGLDEGALGIRYNGAHAVLRDGFYAQLAACAGLVICGAALSLDLRAARSGVRKRARRSSRRRRPQRSRKAPSLAEERDVSEGPRYERLLPFACLRRAALLIASQLMDIFRFDATDQTTGGVAAVADRGRPPPVRDGGPGALRDRRARRWRSRPARSRPPSQSPSPAPSRSCCSSSSTFPTPARWGPSAMPGSPSSMPRPFPREASGWS